MYKVKKIQDSGATKEMPPTNLTRVLGQFDHGIQHGHTVVVALIHGPQSLQQATSQHLSAQTTQLIFRMQWIDTYMC